MPTAKPRLTITLSPAVATVLRQLSEVGGESQSAIVSELLETSLPVFERVVAALRAAHSIQDTAKSEIAAGLDRAQSKIEEQMGLALGQFDELAKPLLQEAERIRRGAGGGGVREAGTAARATATAAKSGSTPVPVTRGSGLSKGAVSRQSKGVRNVKV